MLASIDVQSTGGLENLEITHIGEVALYRQYSIPNLSVVAKMCRSLTESGNQRNEQPGSIEGIKHE